MSETNTSTYEVVDRKEPGAPEVYVGSRKRDSFAFVVAVEQRVDKPLIELCVTLARKRQDSE